LCAGPGMFGENDVGGDLQVEADPGGGEGGDRDGDVGVVGEVVDGLLTHSVGLVAADGDRPKTRLGEVGLGSIHDVNVFGEEDDFADGSGELRGVVGGEHGFGGSDLAHHGEDVVAG